MWCVERGFEANRSVAWERGTLIAFDLILMQACRGAGGLPFKTPSPTEIVS